MTPSRTISEIEEGAASLRPDGGKDDLVRTPSCPVHRRDYSAAAGSGARTHYSLLAPRSFSAG